MRPRTFSRAPQAPPAPPAFTLIELLVVISILAVLIALLMPTLKESREMALSLQCAANIRAIDIAGNAYTLDNKEKMPYGMYMQYNAGQVQPANCYTWDDLMDSYLGGDLTAAELASNSLPANRTLKVLVCPKDKTNNGMPTRSYSINHAIGGDNWQGGNGVALGQPVNGPTSARFSKIPVPSATLFFVESPSYWTGGARGRVEGNSYSRCPADQSVGVTASYTYHLVEWQPGVALHTRDTFNYAFVDGHIAAMYPTESDGQYGWPGHPNGIIYDNTWANGDAVGFWSINPND